MHWIYAHLIGDYLLQNDWMAFNKKAVGWRGNIICFVHVIVYTIPFYLCNLESWQIVAIAIQHYVLDSTMIVGSFIKLVGRKKMLKAPYHPYF